MLPKAACPTLEVWAVESHPPEVVWGLNGKSEISVDQNDVCPMCKSFVPKATGALKFWSVEHGISFLSRNPVEVPNSATALVVVSSHSVFEVGSGCWTMGWDARIWKNRALVWEIKVIDSCCQDISPVVLFFNVCHWWSRGSFLAAALRPEEFKAMLGISDLEMSLVWAIYSNLSRSQTRP